MKKTVILGLMIAVILGGATLTCNAATTTTATTVSTVQWDSESALKRVNTIGQKLMKANNLPDTITFKVSNDDNVNAYANLNKEVYVYKGLLEYVTDDNELAAVISHELGHIINGHCAKQTVLNSLIGTASSSFNPQTELGTAALGLTQNLASSKVSRNDEFEADLTGTDLLVRAGYNPLAMISVLNKICGNYFDVLSSHPSGERRLMNIYDYVEYNYNSYTKTGYKSDSYKKATSIINANIAARNNNAKKLAKFQKEQAKLKAKKQKREIKMVKSGSNPWETSLGMMQMFAQ